MKNNTSAAPNTDKKVTPISSMEGAIFSDTTINQLDIKASAADCRGCGSGGGGDD